MTIQRVDLVDYVAIAAEITGMDVTTITRLPNLALAESALRAPFAGFGDHEFYPQFVDRAAVLLERLARNHPLPDGNKRAAWVTLRVFVEVNDWTWQPYPTVDQAERAVYSIAAGNGITPESARGCAGISSRPPQVGRSRRDGAAGSGPGDKLTIAFVA